MDILVFWALKLPDWMTAGSRPAKASSLPGWEKRSILPIPDKIIAPFRCPMPGIDMITESSSSISAVMPASTWSRCCVNNSICAILEDTLKEKIVEAINIAVSGKNSFLAILKENIETVLSDDLDESTADIDKRLEELQTELIQKANSKEAYDNIVNEIYRLRDLRQETLSRNALRQDKRDRIAEMTDFLNTQTGDITEFDDKLVRKLVEKATVYDDRILVEFKSGLEIEVNL